MLWKYCTTTNMTKQYTFSKKQTKADIYNDVLSFIYICFQVYYNKHFSIGPAFTLYDALDFQLPCQNQEINNIIIANWNILAPPSKSVTFCILSRNFSYHYIQRNCRFCFYTSLIKYSRFSYSG